MQCLQLSDLITGIPGPHYTGRESSWPVGSRRVGQYEHKINTSICKYKYMRTYTEKIRCMIKQTLFWARTLVGFGVKGCGTNQVKKDNVNTKERHRQY